MTLLDRYLLQQFAKNFLLVLISLIAVYLLIDFFERIDNFSEAGKPIGLVIKYLLLKIPIIYDQLVPVCILLAGIITLGILNHNHEMMALKSAGICVTRIVRPLLAVTLLLSFLTLIAAQWILPAAVTATNKIWFEGVKKRIPKGINRNGRTFYKGIEGIYSFRRTHPEKHQFAEFSYTRWDDQYRLQLLLTAQQAVWENGTWTLTNGQLKQKTGQDTGYEIMYFNNRTFTLPEQPADFFIPPYKTGETSLSQMYARAKANNSHDNNKAWIDFHGRLSYVFLGLPLILIGIPILLIVHKKWGNDLSLTVPISCGIAFAAWGWWSASQSLAKAAYLHPAIASWSIHFVIGGIGLLLIRRQNN
jgi:lipopolysaccharide export system permease protein